MVYLLIVVIGIQSCKKVMRVPKRSLLGDPGGGFVPEGSAVVLNHHHLHAIEIRKK